IKIYLDAGGDESDDESEDRLLKKIWYGLVIEEGDWHDVYELVTSGYDDDGDWYNLNGENYIHIVFEENDVWDDCLDMDQHFHIITEVDDNELPKIDNWHCGDTHYHSSYTDTSFEFGAPLDATTKSLKALGLEWVTVTDHSNSFGGHIGDEFSWENFKADCNGYNECLVGTEINCNYGWHGSGNHLLAYDYSEFIDDKFDWYIPGFDNPSCFEMISEIDSQGGFTYPAHPESVMDPWDLLLDKWHDYSLPFSVLEIWNGDIMDTEDRDWDGNSIPDGEERIEALEDGLEKWKDTILGREGLTPRKVFISAGSDAHGDFQEFGKEYTCCYAPSYSKSNIFDALENGRCYMGNNGALIFDVNGERIGGAEIITEGDQVNLNIDYNIIDGCWLKVFKGEIGGDDVQIGSSSYLSSGSSGNIVRTDLPTQDSYYRLECISSDGDDRIYTNPIWVDVEGGDQIERVDFIAKIDSEPDGMCVDFAYWIDAGYYYATLPEGMSYDPSYPIGSFHVKIFDVDGKLIDLVTSEECTNCNIVPMCQMFAGFTEVLYNGQPIIQGSCTTTSAETEICWEELDFVKISRSVLSENCYRMELGDYESAIINETEYGLRFGSLNTIYDYCKLRVDDGVDGPMMDMMTLKTGEANQSLIVPLLFNTTLCNTDNQILEFCVYYSPPLCVPDWSCSPWQPEPCPPSKIQTRTCVDLNECGTDEGKPSETQSCDYIEPPPLCTLSSPINGSIYPERRILFDVEATEKLDKIEYIDYSETRPRWKRLCSKCEEYSLEKSFTEGEHEIAVRCVPYYGEPEKHELVFTNDYKDPSISRTEPRRNDFTNGSDFMVRYTEENVEEISLFWNPSITKTDCESGRNQECYFNINLTDYDNQEIGYYFTIEDIAGNTDESRLTEVKVDTTSPVLNNPDSFWWRGEGRYEKYVYFEFDVTENDFDEINYIDWEDRNPRERRLCSRLRDEICETKKRFDIDEDHNLTITILDEAGNSWREDIIL
ncbi:MAG: CehA/McbA family metallohydrolase, partial [Nanoarchaeota archaeon]|nr:CehA/McbA family metallohydrolase [Nanoarchaeota archaeon]